MMVDWDFWKHTTEVELWQAAFLSCDIDPNSQSYRDICSFGLDNDKVSKHLRLLKSNFHKREFFSPCTINIGDSNLNRILLPEFAAWCIHVGLPIPKQLGNMAVLTKIYAHQATEKRNAGRYTLEEAATLIEQETGERASEMLKELKQAARDGVLPVYEPGKKARYQLKQVREFYEEAYWNDLNDWLKKNEQRIGWMFPNPETPAAETLAVVEQAPSAAQTETTANPPVEKTRPKRINENRAFLLDCERKGILMDIESIWLHIRQNAGKENFLFKTAGQSTATTLDGKTVEKKNLGRTLSNLKK